MPCLAKKFPMLAQHFKKILITRLELGEGTDLLTPSFVPKEEAPSMDEKKDCLTGRFVQWKENVQSVSFSWSVALIFYDTYVFWGSFVVRFVYFTPFLKGWFGQRKETVGLGGYRLPSRPRDWTSLCYLRFLRILHPWCSFCEPSKIHKLFVCWCHVDNEVGTQNRPRSAAQQHSWA